MKNVLFLLFISSFTLRAETDYYGLNYANNSEDFINNVLNFHGFRIKPLQQRNVSNQVLVHSVTPNTKSVDDADAGSTFKKFNVISGSMLPTIPVGSIISVNKEVPFEQITPGDIIVYKTKYMAQHGSSYVVHRVVSRSNGVLICKGDHNINQDKEQVSAYNYVGKVESINKTGILALN